MALKDSEALEERLIQFAVRIGRLVNELPNTRLGNHIAGQIIRSGTSPAPNYAEAVGADFIHKLGICLKELRETRVWLRIIIESEILPETQMSEILDECVQLNKIIASSILTARQNK